MCFFFLIFLNKTQVAVRERLIDIERMSMTGLLTRDPGSPRKLFTLYTTPDQTPAPNKIIRQRETVEDSSKELVIQYSARHFL